VGDQRFQAAQARRLQCRDVTVAAVFANQGQGVPQHEMRSCRPVELGIRGVQGTTVVTGNSTRRDRCQIGSLGHVRRRQNLGAEQPGESGIESVIEDGHDLVG